MRTLSDYQEVEIPVGSIKLKGDLKVVENAKGIVIFSHGSGSSRMSPRNVLVAEMLQKHGFATLLFDLLTEEEDRIYETRFDINLLTGRLTAATHWVEGYPQTKNLKIGYFGASTGAASALKAAAEIGAQIKALVSRGGRPDLALDDLELVKTPTLLIVGERDKLVIRLNDQAYQKLRCAKKMVFVTNATHLFPEEGKLEEVAELAAGWFEQYLQ